MRYVLVFELEKTGVVGDVAAVPAFTSMSHFRTASLVSQ